MEFKDEDFHEVLLLRFGEWNNKYLDVLEEYLQDYISESYNRAKEELGEEYISADEDLAYSIDFPNILRTSYFITCYSYLEQELVDECRLHKEKSFHIDVNDLRGDGIERARNYLNKITGFDLSKTKSWYEIKHIQSIRNCIVHGGGDLTKCKEEIKKEIKKYIKDRKGDIFLNNNHIILSADYCRHVINTFSAFEIEVRTYYRKQIK